MRFLSLFSGMGGFDKGFEMAGMECVGQVEIDKDCLKEMREASSGRFPKYVLFENVPGLFSAANGRDFGIVLNKLAQCGAVDIAWRVIDSQHWVPQRRRRVFVVASFSPVSASGAAIGRSGQILAIAESCGGHPAAGRAAGEDVAAPLGASTTSFGGQRYDLDNETYVPEIVGALDTSLGHHGYATSAQSAVAGHFLAIRTAQTGANGHGIAEDVTHTLDGTEGQAVAFDWQAGHGNDESFRGKSRQYVVRKGDYTGSLQENKRDAVQYGASVRRLTPVECLRLQGFPDDWLDGLGLADGPKYRMCGNAVTVPVIEWIGRRIMAVDRG